MIYQNFTMISFSRDNIIFCLFFFCSKFVVNYAAICRASTASNCYIFTMFSLKVPNFKYILVSAVLNINFNYPFSALISR